MIYLQDVKIKFNNVQCQLGDIEYTRFTEVAEWHSYLNKENKKLQIIHLNIRSLRKNFNQLQQLLNNSLNNLDVLILTEINIKSHEVPLYNIQGFNSYANTREKCKGGGILVYVRNTMSWAPSVVNGTACEVLHGQLELQSGSPLHIIAVYRPPKTNQIRFVEELNDLVKDIQYTRDIVFAGDINLNILNGHTNSAIRRYKDMLCKYGLQCAYDDVTREEVVSGRVVKSCVDHVWVRAGAAGHGRSAAAAASYVLSAGKISDHYLTGLILHSGEPMGTSDVTKKILINKLVQDKLSAVDWDQIMSIDCPLLMYQRVSHTFSDIYCSSKKDVILKNKRLRQPWVSNTLELIIKRRDELFQRWKSAPNIMSHRLDYTRYRNRVNKIIDNEKNKYRQSILDKCNGDFRKIWSNINEWLGKTKGSIDGTIMKYLGRENDVESICNNFSKTFTEEIDRIKHKCDRIFLERDSYTVKNNVSFCFRNVTAFQVQKIIEKMSCEKAPGWDEIRVQDLKFIKIQISPILAKFINLCIKKGVYPGDLKIALIRPIYKQGNHMDYANYRPIAILSVINKITEKIVIKQLMTFLDKYKILSERQHGFRKSRSTATALEQFSDYMYEQLNEKNHVVAIFIDFKKAFDTLEHDVLMQAMLECGVGGPVAEWLRQYLTERNIITVINNVRGEKAKIKYGVPTGSVYGPVGYIMHVNSICNVLNHCNAFMYADDTCIVYANKDQNTIENKIQKDIDNIIKWSHDNGIIINIKKTKGMHLSSPHNIKKAINYNIIGHEYECLHNNKYNCQCKPLEFVENYKYLGLTIDRTMSWKKHVQEVCDKLRILLVKFYHLKRILNRKVLRTIYFALVDSLIDYGLVAYGRTFKSYLDQIKALQLRFLKMMVNTKTRRDCKGDYEKLFSVCNILPVHEKVKCMLTISQFQNYISLYKTPNRITRRPIKAFNQTYKPKNYYGARTVKYILPRLLNTLPRTYFTDNKTSLIKKQIKKFYLNKLKLHT